MKKIQGVRMVNMNLNGNGTSDEILSPISSLKGKLEDLEMIIGEAMSNMQTWEKHLESLIKELHKRIAPPGELLKKSEDMQFQEYYHSIEEQRRLLKLMEDSKKSSIDAVKNVAKCVEDLKGVNIINMNLNGNGTSDEILSSISSIKGELEGMKIRIGEHLSNHRTREKYLVSLREELYKIIDPSDELLKKSEDMQFPEYYHSVEEQRRIFKLMGDSKKSSIDTAKNMAKCGEDLKGKEIFKGIEKHPSSRLEFLATYKKLLEKPLVEEPPPPQEEQPEENMNDIQEKKEKSKRQKKK